jgi:hypothetical protein
MQTSHQHPMHVLNPSEKCKTNFVGFGILKEDRKNKYKETRNLRNQQLPTRLSFSPRNQTSEEETPRANSNICCILALTRILTSRHFSLCSQLHVTISLIFLLVRFALPRSGGDFLNSQGKANYSPSKDEYVWYIWTTPNIHWMSN